ncbi:hypothetical protein N7474_004977 [Penicillium riverlandense]|uniref:uncharacterized protein n=1 Tax=Penicillium riverlandense TaxID=1903569 RepID=UPI002546EDDF|nr:uncharacterized protein N7474_004977 [Penicillium riverlandense]KAJ5819386.1 hypothetical protein N7474_004977 [Penicillium riverlandense]
MSVEYRSEDGVFTDRQTYESVSWRYVLEWVTNIANSYLVNEHAQDPNVAIILAGRGFNKYRDAGTCYQMWPTKFEVNSYVLGYRIAGDGVPHYNYVRTEYRMFWTTKKWEITGVPNEVVPAFDHIQSLEEVVELFIQGLHAAGISPLGGSRARRLDDSEDRKLEVEDYMADYVGTLRPVDQSPKSS